MAGLAACDNVSLMATPSCSICRHPKLAAIEAALTAGGKLVETASAFCVSKSALGRHRLNCLAPKLQAMAKLMQPARETRTPVERAKAIAFGEAPSADEVLTLTGLLDRLSRSLNRLEAAADEAVTDKMHSALAAVSGQLHRGVEAAAKLQGFYVEAEADARPPFSISIVFPPEVAALQSTTPATRAIADEQKPQTRWSA